MKWVIYQRQILLGTIWINSWRVKKHLNHQQNEILRSVNFWSTHSVIFWNKFAQFSFFPFVLLLKNIKFYCEKLSKGYFCSFDIRGLRIAVTWFRILQCVSNPFFKGLHQILWLPFNKFWFRRYVILPSSFIPSYWTTVLLSKKVQNLFFKAKNYSITHHCVYLQWFFLKFWKFMVYEG